MTTTAVQVTNGGHDNHDQVRPPDDEGFFATSDIEERPLPREWDGILTERASSTNTVSLSRCELTTVPGALPSLVQLTRLYLTYNKLKDLPDDLEKLVNLTILNVGFNELESVPPAVFRLDKLQVLFLKNNQLKSIGDRIGLLTNLEELYLNNNTFDEFPSSLCKMANLRLLTMSNNAIEALPSTIVGMAGLQVLKMRSNRLTTIPEEFGQLRALMIACFSQNMINTFPFEQVDEMRNLHDLCLYANRLRDKDQMERCVYIMEKRGGMLRAEENRVMLPRMGGVCDSPFRISKYDIIWLHDGEKSVQTWINKMSKELSQNHKLTTQDYGPSNAKMKNNLKRSRTVAVFCTVKMCGLLREDCPDGELLRTTLLQYFQLDPTGNKESTFLLIVDKNADVSRFFPLHDRCQTVLFRRADGKSFLDELVKTICKPANRIP